METLEQLKEIVKNAPEGATHFSSSVGQSRYLKHNVRREFVYYDGRTFCSFPSRSRYLIACESIRSLSDIKLIIELMELNQEMHLQVSGYLCGEDWSHWQEFNAKRFSV